MGLQIALPTVRPKDGQTYLDILDGEETWLQRRLARGGLAKYEPETLATLLALVSVGPPEAVFLDVGAHFGLYAGVLERLYGDRLQAVHSFEPTPATFQVGCKFRAANQLRFGYHRVALSNAAGEASFYLSRTSEVTNSLVAGFRRARGTLVVETTRLDDVVARFDISPSLIKIDVEGHELPVLEGSLETIERYRPSLVVEVLERHHETFLSTQVWQRLQTLGYRFYHVNPAVPWRANKRNDLYPRSRELLLVAKALERKFWLQYMAWRYAISRCTRRHHRTS